MQVTKFKEGRQKYAHKLYIDTRNDEN